jgi:hypothetical protein
MPVTHELFYELAPVVHRFSMNAYDFSAPGPNAPYPWLKQTLEKLSPMERQKLLMGLPFYGYDNNGRCASVPSVVSPSLTIAHARCDHWKQLHPVAERQRRREDPMGRNGACTRGTSSAEA